MSTTNRGQHPVAGIFRAAEAIGHDDLAPRRQQGQAFGQALIQRNILKAFRKKADVEAGRLGLKILEHAFMHAGGGCIGAAAPGKEGAGHNDIHGMAKGQQLFRGFARAATDIKNTARTIGQQCEQPVCIGFLRGTQVGGADIQPVPQAVVQIFSPGQPFGECQPDIKADGLRVDLILSHRAQLDETRPSGKHVSAGPV